MKICPSCQRTYPDDFSVCPRDATPLAAQETATEAQLAAGLARRYRIIRRLGGGGMGTVFLAEQIAVGNRPVALKVLNRKLLDDPQFLTRFQDEAGSTGRIRHPNVVTIYESAQADDGTPYIAMEFLEGESLRDSLTRQGALPVAAVAEILQQTARGLNAAHKLGIIHRDLKPDNIFLTYSDDDAGEPLVGTHDVGAGLVPALPVGMADPRRAQDPPLRSVVVKLVDFGIAKLRESVTHTQTGMVLGTPAYMSFEQASGMRSDQLDARSDVYSLGVVVYEMLSGRAPFHSDTPVGYLRKHLMEEPPPLRAVAPGLAVSAQVEAVVMKALAKDRDERYASAVDFARAFIAATLPSPGAEVPVALPSIRLEPPLAVEIREPFVSGTVVQPTKQPPSDSKHEAKANSKDELKYVWIPPGTFTMGCSQGDGECDDNEKPPHQVSITKGFWLGRTEVTVEAYKRFAEGRRKAMPSAPDFNPRWSNDQLPIVNVNWEDAQAYCVWAGGRLPTEAEWEYAARAGNTKARYGPIDKVAWYTNNSGRKAHEVGQKQANTFGLYDVLGNVWEWVNDWYDEHYYQSGPSQDPRGPTNGTLRVLRGGSWDLDPWFVRVSGRDGYLPSDRDGVVGFCCGGEVFAP